MPVLKDLLKEVLDRQLNPNVESIKYTLRYPSKDTLIKLDINKVLERHKQDSPEYEISNRQSKNVISKSRIDNAKEYWVNYSKDRRWLHPKTNTRSRFEDIEFEPSIISFYNNKLGFTDGRHRLVAMKELGYNYAMFEIPKTQLKLFNKLK